MPPSEEVRAKARERLEMVKSWIINYHLTNFRPPSMTEIADEFKTSKQVVFLWVEKLEDQHWLEPRAEGQARNIVPCEIANALRTLRQNSIREQECAR